MRFFKIKFLKRLLEKAVFFIFFLCPLSDYELLINISNLIIFFFKGNAMPENFEFNETAHALDFDFDFSETETESKDEFFFEESC